MMRGCMPLLTLALAVACRGNSPPERENPPAGARTGSPYSAGSDSGAARQQMEGVNTGVEFEAPRRIPGVVAALTQLRREPSRENLTAVKGDLGTLEDAMANDLSRVGLADTGQFSALTDSIAREDLSGGPGGLADPPKPGQIPRLEDRVRRLIEVYQRMMSSVRK
jgi:hypothetical protein